MERCTTIIISSVHNNKSTICRKRRTAKQVSRTLGLNPLHVKDGKSWFKQL
uniref:Uncharacterized protein n=1 Tax=Arundo donax TaxID=35708 RepID=A0A0A9C5P0_ARUDO